MVMPMYISEMSSKQMRGLMISLIGLGNAIGTIMGLLSNIGFKKFGEGWRVTCSIVALGELMLAMGFLFLPYTPR